MFNINNKTNKVDLDFNVNKLIIKLNKEALVSAPIKPREIKSNGSEIQPTVKQAAEPMFEIY
jgi:hypothetical protein